MLFRKTVRATTIDQFETALDRADRIVVEGDDHLLAYAASRAAGAPPGGTDAHDMPASGGAEPPVHAVHPPMGWPTSSADALPPRASPVPEPNDTFAFPPAAPAPLPPMAPKNAPLHASAPRSAGGIRGRLLALAALIVVAAGTATWWHQHRSPGKSALPAPSGAQQREGGAAPGPAASPSSVPVVELDEPANSHAGELPSDSKAAPSPPMPAAPVDGRTSAPAAAPLAGLVWPVVALVALVLMYLLARQAIAGGSNVKLEWKVTEKVSGRIVITKVRGS